MAHIASCIQDRADSDCLSIRSYIVRPLSPLPPAAHEVEQQASKPWVWRMAQPETRRYQLFPREKQAAASSGKGLDPEQAFALAMGQNGDQTEKPVAGSLRLRIMEHNLTRRRKVSVPELGPMTTVHESSMDSPTIPGRPAFHERSISAPGNGWKQHHPAYRNASDKSEVSPVLAGAGNRPPPSPKDLPPLVIPTQTSNVSPLKRQLSLNRLRSGSTGNESGSTRSARADDSPRTKCSYTPALSIQTNNTPSSAATTTWSNMTASTVPTPVSATNEFRASPRSFKTENTLNETAKDDAADIPAPMSAIEPRSASALSFHRRNVSESGSVTSIMDRGRPRKKTGDNGARPASKRTKSSERRAFETLPKGWKVPDAVKMLDPSEATALHKQAVQQASRFEILRKVDVDSLSRELRNLDERTEYLRRTYHSLRAGRRNLHSRICQYLRSPRMVKFSQDSLLKQEEALAELDASIDDWVSKLEQAENRRTRVRQKLLEHVAAAVTLPTAGVVGVSESLQLALGVASPSIPTNISTPPRSPTKGAFTPQTSSPSPPPQRVVAQVPSTIMEQPIVEEEAAVGLGIDQPEEQIKGVTKAATEKAAATEPLTAGIRRTEVESIRIYAGDEVAALLADVEQQITRMSKVSEQTVAQRAKDAACDDADDKDTAHMSETERRELHRAQSHEALQGLKKVSSIASIHTTTGSVSTNRSPTSSTSRSTTPRSATPTVAEEKSAEHDGGFLLSSAVFNPAASVSR